MNQSGSYGCFALHSCHVLLSYVLLNKQPIIYDFGAAMRLDYHSPFLSLCVSMPTVYLLTSLPYVELDPHTALTSNTVVLIH